MRGGDETHVWLLHKERIPSYLGNCLWEGMEPECFIRNSVAISNMLRMFKKKVTSEGWGVIRKSIATWLVKKLEKGQSTFCFCPGCGLELCNSKSWFSDTDLVQYKCIQCGTYSK